VVHTLKIHLLVCSTVNNVFLQFEVHGVLGYLFAKLTFLIADLKIKFTYNTTY